MKKKNNKKRPLQSDHRLVTRRDFLAQGLLGMSAQVLAPSLYTLLRSNNAMAQQECLSGFIERSGKTPIVMIDLAGGGNIAGSNVLVGGQMGQQDFISSYKRLGLPENLHPRNGLVNNEYGLHFHSMSSLLAGMNSVTASTTRQKCEGAVFCAISNDDTGNNPHNPVYWLNKAGAVGDIVQTIGTEDGKSGGRSTIPTLSYDPTVAPVRIRRPEDAVELVGLGRVHDIFSKSQAQSVLRAMERMNDAKLRNFSRRSLPDQIKEVVRCGYAKAGIDKRVHNEESRFSSTSIDPRNDGDVTSVFNDLGNGRQRQEASVAKLVLEGYAGTGTIEMGGYDYHNRARSQTEQKDFEAGEAIGRVLELAARKEKDVAIYVFTDGGISSSRDAPDDSDAGNGGKLMFTNDDGQRASTFMIVYRHNGRPNLRHQGIDFNSHKRQVGYFKDDSNVQKNANMASNNVVNLSKAIVLNYLALHGEESALADVVGDNPFGGDMDNYIIFDRLA